MATLTQADRQEWTQHPVTQEFLKKLEQSRQETLETWAREGYISDSAERSALMNAKALGGIGLLDQIIDLIQDMKAPND